jgi:hypothetical protein
MTSTRNKNTPGNYCLEQREHAVSANYNLYKNSAHGAAYDTKLPGNGMNPAQIPWNQMSANAPDIESFLFGIGSTNLVNPAPIFVPRLTTLASSNLFEKTPVLVPEPLIIEKNQRPMK